MLSKPWPPKRRLCPRLSPQHCIEQTPPNPPGILQCKPPAATVARGAGITGGGRCWVRVSSCSNVSMGFSSHGEPGGLLLSPGSLVQPACARLPGVAGPAGWVGCLPPPFFPLCVFLFPSPKARVIYFFFPHRFRWRRRWSSGKEGQPTPPAGLAPGDWDGGRAQRRAGAEPGRGGNN